MKQRFVFYMVAAAFALAVAGYNDKDGDSLHDLRNTKWKLEKLVDMETGETVKPEPEYDDDGEPYHYLEIGYDLNATLHLETWRFDLDLVRNPTSFCTLCDKMFRFYIGNGELFRNALCYATGCQSGIEMEDGGLMRVYCGNKCLIFKLMEQ